MFDKAEVKVTAGNGGDGSVTFRREKFVPFGGPDGGDGGTGGSIIVRASRDVDNLRQYRQKRTYGAEKGAPGGKSRKHGKNGRDLVLDVPAGTIVTELEEDGSSVRLADLKTIGEEVTVAKGGGGGYANVHFTSSTNQAPHIAQRGETAEEKNIGLEMRLIADVGIIGYPNAGKSTLLTAASSARPKVANYPFTTLEPVLGVIEVGLNTFVLAEIPGLIEGAHAGKGLGHEFLRHAMRTRIFIHIISGDAESPIDDMLHVNDELVQYEPEMASRQQLVAVNKIDMPEVQEKLDDIKRELKGAGVHAHYISAATGEGVAELMEALYIELQKSTETVTEKTEPVKVFRPRPRDSRYRVTVEKNEEQNRYYIDAPELYRLYVVAGATSGELKGQMVFQLQKMGAWKEVEKKGIQKGEIVHCGDMKWIW